MCSGLHPRGSLIVPSETWSTCWMCVMESPSFLFFGRLCLSIWVCYGLTFFIFSSTLWLMDLTASYAFQLWTNKLRQCAFPFDSEVCFLKISFWFSLCDLSASLCLCCVNTSWMFKLASGYSTLWQYLFVAVSSSAVFYPLAAVDVGSGCLEWNCLKSSLKKQWVCCWCW